MEISQTFIINGITIAAVVAFAWYIKRNFGVVMAQVKEHLFTCHGIVISLIWALLTTGVFCSIMFVRVSSGDSLSFSYPTEEGISEIIKPKKGK